METKVKIGKDANVWISWNVNSVDYSQEKEENIKKVFANKYGISEKNIYVEPNFISKAKDSVISLNKDNIQSVQDPKFQHELFKQYLEEKGISDYDFEEILNIDGQINTLIDYDSYEKGKKYTLKWLDWDNFLSYGPDNHMDFTQFQGLNLINSIPGNQGGKSTFAYDLLHFLFFGKTSSGKMQTLGDLFNDNLPEETNVKVEGCINVDGEDYIIRRTLTRPKLSGKTKIRNVSQKVEYFHILENGNKEELSDVDNLNEENNVKTSKAIKEAIGNERDFDMVISANADNLKDLISLKETERGRLLSRWIGLMPLEDKDIKAREKWNKEISINRYCNKYNRETLKSEIEYYSNLNEDYKKEIKKEENKKKESEDKVIKFQSERDTLLSSKKNIDENLLKVDVVTLENSIKNITEQGLNIKAKRDIEIEKLNTQYSNLPVVDENQYKSYSDAKDSLVENIANIKAEIITLKNNVVSLEKSEYCPTCGRKFENIDNSAKINECNNKITSLINEGTTLDRQRQDYVAYIEQINVIRLQNNEKNKIELLISKYNVELANLREQLTSYNQTKKDIELNKQSIENNNKIDTALNIVTENIKVEENIISTSTQNIISYKKEIEVNEKGIVDRNVIINKINEEEKQEKNWKTYLMLVGKDGISKMVLRNALPIINSELKRLLNEVCDFDVEVQMDDKNDVNFKLISKKTGVVRRLSAGSGFEQTTASLALRVVLGSMSALSKPPFLLLDEVIGGVNSENYDNLKKLYDKISQYYTFVFQICHVPLEWYEKTITIIKSDKGISTISAK